MSFLVTGLKCLPKIAHDVDNQKTDSSKPFRYPKCKDLGL